MYHTNITLLLYCVNEDSISINNLIPVLMQAFMGAKFINLT
jgi:hypothetical protein